MNLFGLPLLAAPQTSLDHQLAQRFPADVELVFLAQVLAGQRRSESAVDFPRENPHGFLAQLRA